MEIIEQENYSTKRNSKIMEEVFDEYGRIYETILKNLYPAKNSNGFCERNLSVNFSKAYEKKATENKQTAISWFEFPFGKKLHLDLIIMNVTKKELILIESKKFNNPIKKFQEFGEDIDRIYSCIEELKDEDNGRRIDMKKYMKKYGLLLADVWTENPLKESIYKAYNDNSFLETFSNQIESEHKITRGYYYTYNFKDLSDYHLVSLMWQL